MSFFTIILLALSLSADAFAVAVGTGISQNKIQKKQSLSMAFSFGFFQAIMPIIGFFAASLFAKQIMDYDHWIAFVLLGYIGGNMAYEWWKPDDAEEKKDMFTLRSLITLGIATSIDALAIGVWLTASTDDIFVPAIFIGITTFILSFIGIEFGKKFGQKIGSRAEIIGGLILIGIGTNILIEHLF